MKGKWITVGKRRLEEGREGEKGEEGKGEEEGDGERRKGDREVWPETSRMKTLDDVSLRSRMYSFRRRERPSPCKISWPLAKEVKRRTRGGGGREGGSKLGKNVERLSVFLLFL